MRALIWGAFGVLLGASVAVATPGVARAEANAARHPVVVAAAIGHFDWVNSVAFSRDGRLILTGSRDRTVRLWDLPTGALIRTFEDPDVVNSVAFAPDGRRLLSGGDDGTIRLWETDTGGLIRRFEGHRDAVRSVAVSPD